MPPGSPWSLFLQRLSLKTTDVSRLLLLKAAECFLSVCTPSEALPGWWKACFPRHLSSSDVRKHCVLCLCPVCYSGPIKSPFNSKPVFACWEFPTFLGGALWGSSVGKVQGEDAVEVLGRAVPTLISGDREYWLLWSLLPAQELPASWLYFKGPERKRKSKVKEKIRRIQNVCTEDRVCTEDGQALSVSDLLNIKYPCAAPLPTSMTFLCPQPPNKTHTNKHRRY